MNMKDIYVHETEQCFNMNSSKVNQAKRGLDCNDSQCEIYSLQEENDRSWCSSPLPEKHARMERDITCTHYKKSEEESRHGICDIMSHINNGALYVKSETPNVLEVRRSKEITFSHKNIPNTSSGLVTSTKACLPQAIGPRSPEFSVHLLPSSTVYEDIKPSLFQSEQVSTCSSTVGEYVQDQPDSSSSINVQHFKRDHGQSRNKSASTPIEGQTSVNLPATTFVSKGEATLCQVCEDVAAGFYCGAYICEACKKFFIRASKLGQQKYVCLRSKNCQITKESRIHCQYCRYKKCLELNMCHPKDGQKNNGKKGVQEIPCRVCSAPSSGFHFGALTCEGCKGFFRRMVKERDSYTYTCSRNRSCEINALTRNMCKACRYNKCLNIGMSVEGSRIGRQPNSVKHAISLEVRKQIALKVEPGSDTGHKDSNPSILHFDSVTLEPCVPGELDESVSSASVVQVSSSIDVNGAMCRVKQETESLLSSQENQIQSGAGQHDPVAVSVPHSDMVADYVPSLDYHRHPQNVTPSSFSLSSENIPLDTKPAICERSHNETFGLVSGNRTENLSLDLSVSRTSQANPDYISLQSSARTPKGGHFSSSSILPPSIPAPDFINLSPPSPPVSPHYYPIDYTCRSQQNLSTTYYTNNVTDKDQHCSTGYQLSEAFENNSSKYNVDAHRPYHSDAQKSGYIHQQETFINKLCTQNASSEILEQSSVLGNQLSSFNVSCRLPNVSSKEHHLLHLNVLGSPPLQELQVSQFRHTKDEVHVSPIEHQMYPSHVEESKGYRNSTNGDFPSDRSCAPLRPHYHNLSQQVAPYQPDRMSPSYTPSNFQPRYSAYQVATYPNDESRLHLPTSPRCNSNNNIIQSPCNTAGAVMTTRNPHDLSISNEELHGILLDAARNLALFCAVSRAKSDVFDPGRFHDVDSTWERMMDHFNFHAKCIVRFAKRVPGNPASSPSSLVSKMLDMLQMNSFWVIYQPDGGLQCCVEVLYANEGFRNLKIDDQVLLLRMATYSLVILNHSRAYEPETGFYNYFNFTQREIHVIQELFPEFDVLHAHYKHIGSMAQRHCLTELEYAYLSCLILLNDEYPGLENAERTTELKQNYMNAFQAYEIEHFPEGKHRFGEMLLRLSEFSQLSMQHNIAVGLVITKNPQLHIPQLYAEMYTRGDSALDNSATVNEEDAPDVCELHKPSVAGIVK